MFPSNWAERKGCSASKRRKVNHKEELRTLLEHTSVTQPCPAYDDGLVGAIKRQVNATGFVPAIPHELQLDHVLSTVPYQDMLESLFGGVSGQPGDIPLITKAYEESFMREPGNGERPCAMGAKCECMFIDPNAPFVGVEFDFSLDDKGPKMCVLCSRKTTQKLFYDACFTGRRTHGVIQRYGNLCNQPGEYARECMLICPPNSQWNCLPLPIMSHQRNRYTVHIVAGKKHLQQHRVAFEDFQAGFQPPSDRMAG